MLRAITIKTQVRRLAIISSIINITSKNGLPKEILNNRMLNWAEKNQKYFSASPYNSGKLKKGIDTRISNSFKNYLEACFQMKLIDDISNLVSPSKYGKVLKCLLINIDQNPYPLSISEKIFYLYILLKHDADIILTIISMVIEFPERKLSFYLESFKNMYYERLSKKGEISTGKDKQHISDALTRIKNWHSPKRYSEDIVPPRLNWMIDLGIIDYCFYVKESLFRISDFGNQYVEAIPTHEGFCDVSEEWFSKSFMSSLGMLNSEILIWKNVNESTKEQVLHELLKNAITEFSTLGLPKIPLESSLLYIIISLFVNYNILAEANNIESFIGFEKKINGSVYGIRRSARTYESYISVKHGI